METSSIVSLLTSIVTFFVGILVSIQRADIKEMKETLGRLMTKEVCETHHKGHDIEHDRMNKDINGIGIKTENMRSKLENIDIRVTALEGKKQ